MLLGDFNGDGKLDLVVANRSCTNLPCGTSSVSVLLGNGDGTFKSHVDFSTGSGASSASVVVGDFNRDGRLDLAVANSYNGGAGTVAILLGNGDGTFQASKEYPAGANPAALVAADLNGDGKLDLAVADNFYMPTGEISVLLGNGDGTFAAPVQYAVGADPTSVAIGDFNGDGIPDLAANGGTGTVSVLLGKGDGTFQNAVAYASSGEPAVLTVGDFNGDGHQDLAIANANSGNLGTITILLGDGNGAFSPKLDLTTGFSSPIGGVSADFNDDGKADLAIINNDSPTDISTVSILPGNGDGTFQSQPQANFPAGQDVQSVVAADFNGDGKMDLAVANFTPATVSILLGNGDGTFQPPVSYPVAASPNGLAVADFNGDGHLDIAVSLGNCNLTCPGSVVSILLGNGDGTFKAHADYPTAGENGELAVAAGDFNGDGKADLAVSTQPNSSGPVISVLLGNGDGSFQSPTTYPAQSEGPNALAVGDFNGDGKLDLAGTVINNGTSGEISIFLGNGNGSFQAPKQFATGIFSASIAVADFDGDGRLDVATVNTGSETISVLLGNGDGTLQPHLDYITGRTPIGIAAGAFDGPGGGFGLAFANRIDNTVSVYAVPTVALYPSKLTFHQGLPGAADGRKQGGTRRVTAPAEQQTVTITNPGNLRLRFSKMNITRGFAQTNTCSPALPVGQSCTVTVIYAPTPAGEIAGSLVISDNATGKQQIVGLTASAVPAPIVEVTPPSLGFGNQTVGTPSAADSVILTNAGNASLTISNVTVGGANAGDFAETNSCGSSVASGANCTINVAFKPTAAGPRSATLNIADNAANSPQTLALTGVGLGAPDFSLSASPGSATVTPGQSTTYTLTLTPSGGFSQAVSVSCTGAPALATCSVSPNSVTLNGTNAGTANVSVTTTAATMLAPRKTAPPFSRPGAWNRLRMLALWLIVAAALSALTSRRRRRAARLGLVSALLVVMLWASCGGGGGGGGVGGGGNPGTPAGTYTLTLTGTFANAAGSGLTHTTTVALKVE